MILLIDNTIDGQGSSPREIRRALEQVQPDMRVVVEGFKSVYPELVQTLKPSHIILSGQSHPWDDYSPESLAGILEVIRRAQQPVLGICGGQQQMAIAFGAPVGLIQRLAPGEGYEGAFRERGFCTVEVNEESEPGKGILHDLPPAITVWESHCDEVKELPADFVVTAGNEVSTIQAMQHNTRPLFGVQFHPELFDDEHPHGRIILENFLSL
jgi:GMP synthase (glutamine-hydrolysing)